MMDDERPNGDESDDQDDEQGDGVDPSQDGEAGEPPDPRLAALFAEIEGHLRSTKRPSSVPQQPPSLIVVRRLASVQEAINQFLKRQHAEEQARLLDGRKRRGVQDGQGSGPLPLGYMRVWDRAGAGRLGRIIVVAWQAGIVRRIYELRDIGLTVRQIADKLDEEGHRTARGKKLPLATILLCLRHEELYRTGLRHYAGAEARQRWPIILGDDAQPDLWTDLPRPDQGDQGGQPD